MIDHGLKLTADKTEFVLLTMVQIKKAINYLGVMLDTKLAPTNFESSGQDHSGDDDA